MSKSLLEAVDDGDNIILTGGAGVGKTYKTNEIIKHLRTKERKFAVTAMTGLASMHLQFGMTIHSFLGMGSKTKASEIKKLQDSDYFYPHIVSICHVSAIIIDEVSMKRSDQIELVDTILRFARYVSNSQEGGVLLDPRENEPFGGYQLILVGDFCQLPPVVQKHERVPTKWVFQHELITKNKFRIYNLTKVQRTSNEAFATTLNKLRVGYYDDEVIKMIRSRENKTLDGEAVVLMSRVKNVNAYNDIRLQKEAGDEILLEGFVRIREEARTYYGDDYVKQIYKESIQNSGFEKTIKIKIGARIMTLANNPEMNYMNGSQGVVKNIIHINPKSLEWTRSDGELFYLDYKYHGTNLVVLFDDGTESLVPMKPTYVFGTDFDENGKRLADATFYQFPITLGYAITIHKSQGMSLDRMILDCDGIFADGQFYVGISRARSLEGLSIINFETKYIKADQDAVDFYLAITGKPEGFIFEGV